jgi:hypothetical protein
MNHKLAQLPFHASRVSQKVSPPSQWMIKAVTCTAATAMVMCHSSMFALEERLAPST